MRPSYRQSLPRFRSRWAGILQLLIAVAWAIFPDPALLAYWHDPDGDGTPTEYTNPVDTNDPWWSTDSDGDGMSNEEENAFGSDPYRVDGDYDGLIDRDERDYSATDPWNWDSNQDGYSDYDNYYNTLQSAPLTVHYPTLVSNGYAFVSYYDADGDGVYNYQDSYPVDRDNDGIEDWNDEFPDDPMNVDPNADDDGDGIPNVSDIYPNDYWNGNATGDDDGDGIQNDQDSFPNDYWNGNGSGDEDGDGIPNDQDGYPYDPLNGGSDPDSDGDGTPDSSDPYPNDFWNGDGSGDADGDGIQNDQDGFPYDPWNGGSEPDSDGDGTPDSTDPYPNDFWNGNGSGDDDGDGIQNDQDYYPYDSWNGNGSGDDDGDGTQNDQDSHPYDYWNGDGSGDADGDGIPNDQDSYPYDPYNGGSDPDSDGDGTPDSSDSYPYDYWNGNGSGDEDGDGIPNDQDSLPYDPSNGPDADGDGIPDMSDSYPDDPWNGYDADGDGLTNYEEGGPDGQSGLGTDPQNVDTDGDYLTDYEEIYIYYTNPLLQKTNPNQSYSDFYHVSSGDFDSDGLPDHVEDWYALNGFGLDKNNPEDAAGDLDGDGYTNLEAYNVGWHLAVNLGTYDLDGDGLTDAQEDYWSVHYPGILNKNFAGDAVEDADGDGVMNFEEVALRMDPGYVQDFSVATPLVYAFWKTVVVQGIGTTSTPGSRLGGWRVSNLYATGDWSLEGDEYTGPQPTDPNESWNQMSDGIPDGLHTFTAQATLAVSQIAGRAAVGDFDGDGMPDAWEYQHHLGHRDPWNAQPPATWYLGMTPPAPVGYFGARFIASEWDPDADGLTNLEEYQVGTDPRAQDSDLDEYTDLQEVLAGTDPLDSDSYPVAEPDPGVIPEPTPPGGAGPSPQEASIAQALPAGWPADKSVNDPTNSDPSGGSNPPTFEYYTEIVDENGNGVTGTLTEGTVAHYAHGYGQGGGSVCGCGSNSDPECTCGYYYSDGTWQSDCQCQWENVLSHTRGWMRVTLEHEAATDMSYPFTVTTTQLGVVISTVQSNFVIPTGETEVYVPGPGTENMHDPALDYGITIAFSPEDPDDELPKGPPFTFTGTDGAGPRYRKIGLNGAPLSDAKPQVQDESGEVPEETYIDALTRELRHSVTEVYASMESSLLPLMVRRDLTQDTWVQKSGLKLHERADRPFGSGWTSNLTAHLKLENGRKAYVIDEQGAMQVFLWHEGLDAWVHTQEERVDVKARMNTLQNVYSGEQLVGFTYSKKFGTVCHYQLCDLLQAYPADREENKGDLTVHQFFRLSNVEDRLGNELTYTYPSAKTLIPHTISDPDRPGHAVSIRQLNGVVTAVRGPGGDTTSYAYGTVDNAPVLTSVTRGGATVHYEYSAVTEQDPNPPPPGGEPTPVHHVALNKITDENGNSYTFTLAFNSGVTYTKFDENGQEQTLQQTGMGRHVTNVDLPDGSDTVISGVRTLHVSSPSLEGVLGTASTTVTGPGGATSYAFSLPDVFVPLVPDIDNINDPFSRHLTVSFEKMEVTRGGGTETYEFDAEHAMSLVKATDFNGNQTTFAYDWFDDPSEETNALGGVKTFTYDPLTRVMASMTDAAGTVTQYTIQANTGLRTSETITGAGGTVRTTTFQYGHPTFKGFMTSQTVSSTGGGMGSYTVNYTPDSLGRVWKEQVVGGGTTEYYYDYAGNKRFVVDPRGNCTEFSYDGRHRLRRVTNPDGSRKHLAYDPHGNLTLEVDEVGKYSFHQYDVLNRRTQSRIEMNDAPDITLDFTYNGMNLPVTETDPRGLVSTHAYDVLGRRTSTQTGPLLTTFEYGANSGGSVFDVSGFKPTKSTGPRGEVTTVVYDDLYRPVSTTVSDGGTTTTEYDAVGRPVEVTDALGRTTTTTYDAVGQATRVDYPDGTHVETEYTQLGSPWRVEDALGRVTTTQYDSAGRAISVTNALGHEVSTTYDAAGNAISVTDARGKTTETVYDSRNRPIEVKAPEVIDGVTGLPAHPTMLTSYDGAGNVLSVTDALGNVTTKTYDQAGRVVKVKDPLNQETLTTYDQAGNVLTVTDARGKLTTNEYDTLGRLWKTTDAEGAVTEFGYDLSGNRTLVKDGKGNETTFTYDLRYRVTLEHYANGDETSFTYNALQKLTRTDAAGTVTYGYDDRDRLLTVDLPVGADRTYTYDDAGQLLSVAEAGNPAANVSYVYDLLGRVLSETSRGKTHTHTYDASGNRTSTTYDTGTSRSETRTYDALNRIITLEEGGRTTGWHYDLAGRAIALSLGNGQQQDNHYDANGRLVARHLFNANQTLIATFTWQHDAASNVTQQTERWLGDPARSSALRTTTMVYDDVSRLLGETVTQSGEVTRETLYTYDDASNRASKVEKENGTVVKEVTYTYNVANQLTAWSEEDGADVVQRSAVMTYDTRGNRASTAVTTHGTEPTTATTTYAWTAENRLASVTVPGDDVHSYEYDYRMRRITRSEPGSSPVAMTFSGGLSVAEFEVTDPQLGTLNSQPSVEYQRGPDMGGGVGGLLYSLRSGTPKFNLSNGRGDIVAQSDSTGDLTWTASYEAFGKRPVETGNNADRQRANTKDEDPTGLVNEGFRYRELETGAWLSRDPAGFVDGPNLYTYVQQNPWTKFDPDGLFWSAIITVAFAAYDTYQYSTGKISGAEYARNMAVNGAALAADVLTAGNGGGLAVRAAALSCRARTAVVAASRAVEKADNIVATVESVAGAAESIKEGNYGAAALQIGSAALTGKAGASKLDAPTFCFAAGTEVWHARGMSSIETLRPGQRVLTQGDEGMAPTSVSAAEWRQLHFVFADPDGSGQECSATLLRPAWYVAHQGWRAGEEAPVDFGDEVPTATGTARILSITHAPEPEQAAGHVITGTFQTWNSKLCELWMEGLDKPILVTAGHRFYSQTREAWAQAHTLLLGESIRTLDGSGRKVVGVVRLQSLHRVYNIEVEHAHRYHVSSAALLTHNSDGCNSARDTAERNNLRTWDGDTIEVEDLDYFQLELNTKGSYVNKHESGKAYGGHGDEPRATVSAEEKAFLHDDPVVSSQWEPAFSSRQALKDEDRKIRELGGVDSDKTYNKINSPGRKYNEEDAEDF